MSDFAIHVNAILIATNKKLELFPGTSDLDYKYLFTALKLANPSYYSKYIKANDTETILEKVSNCPYALDKAVLDNYILILKEYLWETMYLILSQSTTQ